MSEINQQRIADQLGVSRATVSRCFTNHAGISPTTRAKVFQTAAEIGYKYMEVRSGSGLKTLRRAKEKAVICILLNKRQNDAKRGLGLAAQQLITGVSEYAQLTGANVEVIATDEEIDNLAHPSVGAIKASTKRRLFGVLLTHPMHEGLVRELSLRFPLVSLVDQLNNEPIDRIDVDHCQGVAVLMQHLVDFGHRRIGFYAAQDKLNKSIMLRRFGGYTSRMAGLGLDVAAGDVVGVYSNFHRDADSGDAELLAATHRGITAWVCASDNHAMELIQKLKVLGIEVPKDASVTGFGGDFQSQGQTQGFKLTTMLTPYREIGATGAERLAGRVKKRFHETRQILIAGRFCEGNSVARING